MANFLGPYWVRINYHSARGIHSMTIPTKQWNNGPAQGTFNTWAGATRDANTMITQLVTKMLTQFNADVAFDNFVIYQQLTEAEAVLPVASASFSGLVGNDTGASWASATEQIYVARTAAFGICKLSLLDSITDDNFNPETSLGTDRQAIVTEWFSDTNGWSGRDNTQPSTFLKLTKNLNQKLRKEYRLD